MLAAQNRARRIAWAIGMIGVSVPMVVMGQVAQNVGQEANKIEFSRLTSHPLQEDAIVTTNTVTSTPDLATCLVARKTARVHGVPSEAVRKRTGALLRWVSESSQTAMERQKNSVAVEASRQSPSP
jgi:hypothetical protein